MLKELSVNRYGFGCTHCGHTWTVDYELQHVEDGHGVERDYFSVNGSPATAPTARGVVRCVRCGAGSVRVSLLASRPIPLAEPAAATGPAEAMASPADPVDAAERRRAPLLPAEQAGAPAEQAIGGDGS